MQHTRRHKTFAFTLLELLIALSLGSVLLFCLWQTYDLRLRQYRKLEMQHSKDYPRLFIKQRLDTLFAQGMQKQTSLTLFTSTKHPSQLIILYEGGPDPDPALNGPIRSLLYVDDDRRLCLATWSLDRQGYIEVLASSIEELTLSFFSLETKTWHLIWEENNNSLPLWMKLSYKTEGISSTLCFLLHVPENPIFYQVP